MRVLFRKSLQALAGRWDKTEVSSGSVALVAGTLGVQCTTHAQVHLLQGARVQGTTMCISFMSIIADSLSFFPYP